MKKTHRPDQDGGLFLMICAELRHHAASAARGYGPITLQNIRWRKQLITIVMMPRAELMRHALSQALRRVHIGPKKLKLDEDTRWQIAGEAEAPMRPLAKG